MMEEEQLELVKFVFLVNLEVPETGILVNPVNLKILGTEALVNSVNLKILGTEALVNSVNPEIPETEALVNSKIDVPIADHNSYMESMLSDYTFKRSPLYLK
jgi:hypothetical protein